MCLTGGLAAASQTYCLADEGSELRSAVKKGEIEWKRSRPGFGRKFKLIHLIIVALVVMIVTAAATYLITTGGFGAQKYYNDAKAYVEIEKIIEENYR